MSTYLSTIFLSKWGFCGYIDILLRLGLATKVRALKNMNAVMLRFFCTYVNREWLDQLALWMKNRNCTGFSSVCVSPMWLISKNIKDCNTWQLLYTRYGNLVRYLCIDIFVRMACYLIHGKYNLFCFWNTI